MAKLPQQKTKMKIYFELQSMIWSRTLAISNIGSYHPKTIQNSHTSPHPRD